MKSTRLAGNRTRNVDLVLLFLLMTIALMGYVDLHSSANVAVTGHDKAHLIRLVVGLVDLKSTMDSSMMLNLPTWWSYVPMTISFVLLTATALFTANTNLRKLLK